MDIRTKVIKSFYVYSNKYRLFVIVLTKIDSTKITLVLTSLGTDHQLFNI